MRTRTQEIADEVIKQQVLDAIDVLNEKYGPDWVNHVDPARLSMCTSSACVLGQVYGDYFAGANKLGVHSGGDTAFYSSSGSGYEALDRAWKKVLNRG